MTPDQIKWIHERLAMAHTYDDYHRIVRFDVPALLQDRQAALARLELARGALLRDGYFTPEQVGDDIAPRIVEVLSHLRERITDYENRITWHTTCQQCANDLDRIVAETERAERAEAEVLRLRGVIADEHSRLSQELEAEAELRSEVQRLTDENARLARRLRAENVRLTNDLASVGNDRLALRREVAKLHERLASAEAYRDAARVKTRELQTELEGKAAMEREITRLKDDLEFAQRRMEP
jgi:chromosome segregation ATPase